MATTKRKPAPERSRSKTRTVTKDHRGVVVGSEVAVTIPIGDTTAHLRFGFWHERIAPGSSQESIRKTAELVDEFNEDELNRRLEKYRRLIIRVMNEEDLDEDEDEDEERPKRKKSKSSVQERARKKMKAKK